MKKEFWTKRIALVALTGLISSGLLTGCQKEETENKVVEDANGETNSYKYVVSVTYKMKDSEDANVLLMGLVDERENEKTFRSFRIPEYSLVESYDPESYSTDYKLVTNSFLPEQNEEFTENAEVLSVAYLLSSTKYFSYTDVLQQEEVSLKANQKQYENKENNISR